MRYADILGTEALREHYRDDPNVVLEHIVQVDFPLQRDGQIRTLAEAAGPGGPYRWVVASHVVEHVPNMVGWFADVASLLEDGGRLFLVVPDRRFTFDANRPATTVGQLLEAYTRNETIPPERAVYDYFRFAVDISAAALWAGADPTAAPKAFTFQGTLSKREAALRGEYVDSHVWVFSPAEFVAQLAELGELDLCDFTLERLLPTVPDELEFNALLRRLPRDADEGQRTALRRAAMAELGAATSLDALGATDAGQVTGAGQVTNGRTMEVSELEARLIRGKREAMGRLRTLRKWIDHRT